MGREEELKMREESFTLIELLIVVAIVAILAGAMMPIFNITRQEAKEAKVLAELDAVKMASVLLHYDTDEWPVVGTAGEGLVDNNGVIVGWAGPYLDEWKEDPWGNLYSINETNVEEKVYVYSYGINEEDEFVAAAGGGPGGDDISLLITSDRNP